MLTTVGKEILFHWDFWGATGVPGLTIMDGTAADGGDICSGAETGRTVVWVDFEAFKGLALDEVLLASAGHDGTGESGSIAVLDSVAEYTCSFASLAGGAILELVAATALAT